MNTNQLAKNYDVLAPAERVSLSLAAVARADSEEHRRLRHAAPRIGCQIPDDYPLYDGLVLVASLHQMELLSMVAQFWAAACKWNTNRGGPADGPRDPEAAYEAMRLRAYWFITLLDGWREWGRSLNTDVEALLKMFPGYDLVRVMEGLAREAALTAEEAATRTVGGQPLPGVAEVVVNLQACLDARLTIWK